MRSFTLVRGSRATERGTRTAHRARGGLGLALSATPAIALALLLGASANAQTPAPAAQPAPAASAVASAPAAPPKVLRHLSFSTAIELSTSQEMLGTKDVATAFGASAEHYETSGQSSGSVVCDVVGALADRRLLVDVTENVGDRRNATVRVGVMPDGQLAPLSGQGTMSEEEAELVALLAPGLFGTDGHTVGDSWTFRQSGPDYTASKTFRMTDFKSDADVLLNLEEEYKVAGASPSTGTISGTLHYDPSKLVPTSVNLTKTTRTETIDRYVTRKLAMHFTLTEDSLGKH